MSLVITTLHPYCTCECLLFHGSGCTSFTSCLGLTTAAAAGLLAVLTDGEELGAVLQRGREATHGRLCAVAAGGRLRVGEGRAR